MVVSLLERTNQERVEEFHRIIKDIKDKQYTHVDSQMNKLLLNEIAEAFLAFRRLPQEITNRYQTLFTPGNEHSHVGWDPKRKAHGNKDNKDVFMYNPALMRDFGPQAIFKSGVKDADRFLQIMAAGYDVLHQMTLDVARTLDAGLEGTPYHGLERAMFPEGQEPEMYFRIIAYLDHGEGDQLAKGHYDKGTFTFAFGESDSKYASIDSENGSDLDQKVKNADEPIKGLWIGKNNDENQQVVHYDGKAVLFFAKAAEQSLPKQIHSNLGYHGVRADPRRPVVDDEVKRWAIVAFPKARFASFASWDETHEFEPIKAHGRNTTGYLDRSA